jgi:hypothetical protein
LDQVEQQVGASAASATHAILPVPCHP